MKATRRLMFFVLSGALAACNMALQPKLSAVHMGGDAPEAWMDAPLDGMHLPLAPYEVVLHASDGAGVAGVEMLINDQAAALPAEAGSGQVLETVKYSWSPSAPGEYVLKTRARNTSGQWGAYSIVKVFVGDTTPTVTGTPAVTATPSPTPSAAPGFTILSISTDQFYFGDSSCGPKDVTLEVQVSDAAQTHDVLLFFKLQDKDSGKYTAWNDGLDMQSEGNGKFILTVPSGSIPSIASRDNWFVYQFVGTGADNKPLGRSVVHSDISLAGCGRFILTAP